MSASVKKGRKPPVSKEEVLRVMTDVDELDLPDGAHWALIHDRLELKYGDVFDFISRDPDFFGYGSANKELTP